LGLTSNSIRVALFLFLIAPLVLAGMTRSDISDAENALNVKGFDAGNAYSIYQSDAVNLYSGNLIISDTDVNLPGRNGLDVVIKRQYNSNVFLHYNKYTSADASDSCITYPSSCSVFGAESSKICDDCNFINDPYYANYCYTSGTPSDAVATTFIKPRSMGRGWTMNVFNRIKDPTPIVYMDAKYKVPGRDFWNGGAVKANFLSTFGITTLSMVLDENEEQLIYPSLFSNSDTDKTNQFWGVDVQLVEPIRNSNNTDANFTVFTSDKSPVEMRYNISQKIVGGETIYNVVPTNGTYYDKVGTKYEFSHYVPYRGPYDDLPFNDAHSHPDIKRCFTDWAENPYAGLYLTRVIDTYGNYIKYNYLVIAGNNTPFLDNITDTLGRVIKFYYRTGDPELYKRLQKICYPNFENTTICVHYTYEEDAPYSGTRPLLREVQLKKNNVPLAPSTNYTYTTDFFHDTQELSDIRAPTGAWTHYRYLSLIGAPSLNYVFPMGSDWYDSQGPKKRAVHEKTVWLWDEDTGRESATTYYYVLPVFTGFDSITPYTMVTNPNGLSTIHNYYPATVMPNKINMGNPEASVGGMIDNQCDPWKSGRCRDDECTEIYYVYDNNPYGAWCASAPKKTKTFSVVQNDNSK
jgi:hypothetical protein